MSFDFQINSGEKAYIHKNNVLGLRCRPIEKVKIAFVGLGMRMSATIKRFAHIKDAEIVALCDISQKKLAKARELIENGNHLKVDLYSNVNDWKKVCERKDIDLVYISTHYDLHVPVAVYAMQCGKHAAIEVPAATTLEDCWKLVDTAEATQRHCIQLENCNYGEFEMTCLNIVQQGILGEIIYSEGAYIHDLRELMFNQENGYWNMWRLKYQQSRNGNLYPTHGLGPIAHAMGIHRGDTFDYLVSMSTNHFGLKKFAQEKFGRNSDFGSQNYVNGDMNITLIRTKRGKTISLQHDISSPRPYSRAFTLSGTNGFVQKWPQKTITLEPKGMEPLNSLEMEQLLEKYEHPIRKELKPMLNRLSKVSPEIEKNEGMDFIMDYRLIYCLKKGLPLDMDVYDAAEWSSIIELSEKSVKNNSSPVQIPDFTRGANMNPQKVHYHL